MYKADNAIIMAAGTSSRFAPLSYEMPKGLISVRGEVLIERQIRQLQSAGIDDIIVVTGYKHENFEYLKDRLGAILVHNNEFETRNNNSSIWAARNYLRNTYVCSSDNYFLINPFEKEVDDSYYAAVYSDGKTDEWCMRYDEEGFINSVTVGGSNAWYMLGHTFWSESFSKKFLNILKQEYDASETAGKLWEKIYMEHLDVLKMRIRKYPEDSIYEFDTLDELRLFDSSYIDDTKSIILKEIAQKLECTERDITDINASKTIGNYSEGFRFKVKGTDYKYIYEGKELVKE